MASGEATCDGPRRLRAASRALGHLSGSARGLQTSRDMMNVKMPQVSFRPVVWALPALGLAIASCEDHDAPRPDYPTEPAVYPREETANDLPRGEVSYEGTVEKVNEGSFHIDVDSEATLEDVVVVVQEPVAMPQAGDRVAVSGKFERVAGVPHSRKYDIEFESVDDLDPEVPMLVASKVEPEAGESE